MLHSLSIPVKYGYFYGFCLLLVDIVSCKMLTLDNNIPLLFNTVCTKKIHVELAGLVNFAFGLVNSVVNLPDSEVFWGIQFTL